MRSRPVLVIALVSIVLGACAGDSDEADATLPEVTLITTTSEAPDFEEAEPTVATTEETPAVTEPEITTAPLPETTTLPPETTTLPPETTAPETTQAPPSGDFVLGADGLGAVPFGADPEQTITFVTSLLGAPTRDTGWVDPFEIGPCGGTRIRQVNWNQLQLEFGDVSSVTTGRDHFYAYFYGAAGTSDPQPSGLATAESIGAGSSVAALLAAYPGATLLQGDEFIGPSFIVNDNLNGRLSGVADDDVVEAIIGGRPCDG